MISRVLERKKQRKNTQGIGVLQTHHTVSNAWAGKKNGAGVGT